MVTTNINLYSESDKLQDLFLMHNYFINFLDEEIKRFEVLQGDKYDNVYNKITLRQLIAKKEFYWLELVKIMEELKKNE